MILPPAIKPLASWPSEPVLPKLLHYMLSLKLCLPGASNYFLSLNKINVNVDFLSKSKKNKENKNWSWAYSAPWCLLPLHLKTKCIIFECCNLIDKQRIRHTLPLYIQWTDNIKEKIMIYQFGYCRCYISISLLWRNQCYLRHSIHFYLWK